MPYPVLLKRDIRKFFTNDPIYLQHNKQKKIFLNEKKVANNAKKPCERVQLGSAPQDVQKALKC